MIVAFHYPGRCTGAAFDPANLYTSARGLTGSEEAFFRYARELSRLGHLVRVVCKLEPGAVPAIVGEIQYFPDDGSEQALRPLLGLDGVIGGASIDAVVSWMSPDACAFATQNRVNAFRLYVEQCSDHGNTPYAWEHFVNNFGTLSRSHALHMSRQNSVPAERCRVVPNGFDDKVAYAADSKVPGRCVWASSHDRGLHHLLGVWPEVRRRVPHATLRVLYNPEGMNRFAEMPEQQVDWLENLRRRSAYQLEALGRLRGQGVELVGSVSRAQMLEEFSRAEVLAYPCDPVRYTETFGSTVLEAMAAGCVPVLCLSDAFGELWGEACPGVKPPFEPGRYAELLSAVLLRGDLRRESADRCRTAAGAYSWKKLGKRMELFLNTRGADPGCGRCVVGCRHGCGRAPRSQLPRDRLELVRRL